MGLPILDILGVVAKVVDKVVPDPQAKMQLQLELTKIADQESAREHEEVMGQIQTNTTEASNTNLFVSGWRPFVGWVCGTGVAYSFIVEPFAEFIAKIAGYTGAFPVLDMGNLMTLMMGMLGMGYLRTKEKLGGIADSQPMAPVATPMATPKKKVLGIPWPF
jgi:hypothetical protein